MNAIKIMNKEHNNIKRMLKIVRQCCLDIMNGKEIDYNEFETIIDFIVNYADKHHHNKEEVILFKKMMANMGPVAEKLVRHGMLVEHDFGRLYINDLKEAINKVKDGDSEAKLDVIANAVSYTHLLERHIHKEDNIVYKFAERELSDEILKEVDEECRVYEENNIQGKERYLKILEDLENKYFN